jgi:tetratricopeptide (TPR) repeat protein
MAQQEGEEEQRRFDQRDVVMDVETAWQGHLLEGKRLGGPVSPGMEAAMARALDRIVKLESAVGPTAADLYARLGEVDKAMKYASVGTGPDFTDVYTLASALVKKGRYKDADKYAPGSLAVMTKGYARAGQYEKALKTAERIPLDFPHFNDKGWQRNEAICSVALAQARAGKVDDAVESLEHLVARVERNPAAEPRVRTKEEQQIRYAVRVITYLTQPDDANLAGARKLFAYAKKKLDQVPRERRDFAASEIGNASRRIKRTGR